MFRIGNAFLFVLLSFCVSGYAQNKHEPEVQANTVQTAHVELNGSYFKGYLSDIRDIMTSPMHWNGIQWKEAALIAGIAAALYPFDTETREEVQENRNPMSDGVARTARSFGEGQYIAPALGTLYMYGRLRGDGKARETALLGLESFVVSGVFTGAMKGLAHRDRPNTGHPYNIWHGPGLSVSNLSFPSGHSTAAFSLAGVIASEYSDNRYIPPAAYGIATLTALSRVNDNAHWLSDVFFGSAVGFFTAKAIVNMNTGTQSTLFPVVNGKYAGIMITHPY